MAWCIEEQVVRGEIDNCTPAHPVGKILFVGRDEAVELMMEGNPWRDLVSHVLKFINPEAKSGDLLGLSSCQQGQVGDITASRKVKVPDCTMEELMEFYKTKPPFLWHWGNSLYLEWFSVTNGRVVIEAAHYQLELYAEPAWIMHDEDEITQQSANALAMTNFMGQSGVAVAVAEVEDDDLPQSQEEIQADVEDAQMQLLLDRVTARLERGGLDIENLDQIYTEERASMMRECREKERRLWVEKIYKIANLALSILQKRKLSPRRNGGIRRSSKSLILSRKPRFSSAMRGRCRQFQAMMVAGFFETQKQAYP